MHRCVLSAVATDDQAISIHSADPISIVLSQIETKNITFIRDNIRKWNYILKKKRKEKKLTSLLKVNHGGVCIDDN